MDYTCEKLGVQLGNYSRWTFEIKVECLGACGYAPMMQLGDFYKEHLTRKNRSIN
jgi:NADH-quinone oxidoreductase subunit E